MSWHPAGDESSHGNTRDCARCDATPRTHGPGIAGVCPLLLPRAPRSARPPARNLISWPWDILMSSDFEFSFQVWSLPTRCAWPDHRRCLSVPDLSAVGSTGRLRLHGLWHPARVRRVAARRSGVVPHRAPRPSQRRFFGPIARWLGIPASKWSWPSGGASNPVPSASGSTAGAAKLGLPRSRPDPGPDAPIVGTLPIPDPASASSGNWALKHSGPRNGSTIPGFAGPLGVPMGLPIGM